MCIEKSSCLINETISRTTRNTYFDVCIETPYIIQATLTTLSIIIIIIICYVIMYIQNRFHILSIMNHSHMLWLLYHHVYTKIGFTCWRSMCFFPVALHMANHTEPHFWKTWNKINQHLSDRVVHLSCSTALMPISSKWGIFWIKPAGMVGLELTLKPNEKIRTQGNTSKNVKLLQIDAIYLWYSLKRFQPFGPNRQVCYLDSLVWDWKRMEKAQIIPWTCLQEAVPFDDVVCRGELGVQFSCSST